MATDDTPGRSDGPRRSDTPGRSDGPGFGDGPRRLRIGDADRQQMVDVLQEHLGAGRLDMDEFERRVEHATRAVHAGDLDGLLDDLPPIDGDPRTGPRDDDAFRAAGPPWWPSDEEPWSRGPRWARSGRMPLPLLVLGAFLLVAATHGWILLPLALLFVVRRGGRGGPWCGDGRAHAHRGHHGRGGHRRHGRRHDDEPHGWSGRDERRGGPRGDAAWPGRGGHDDDRHGDRRPERAASPGRYRPPAADEHDDAR